MVLEREAAADTLIIGRKLEKSVFLIRSFICEQVRWRSLFLAGDTAQFALQRSAKGINLYFSSMYYRSDAPIAFYAREGD